jgi:hypothetical protein
MSEDNLSDENNDENKETNQIIKLNKMEEFRFEVDFKKKCTIKLLKGTAEVFGFEIGVNVVNTFSGSKNAVFTYEGCEIEVNFLKKIKTKRLMGIIKMNMWPLKL